jgi:hypothetical protein
LSQVGNRRAIVERLVQVSRDDAALKKKSVATIDPIIKVGRRTYPYLSERQLIDYASAALRIILSDDVIEHQQMKLLAY